jgi:hypothetical protein
MTDPHECPASSLKVFVQPLILRNIRIALNILDVDTVILPEEYYTAVKHFGAVVDNNCAIGLL